MVSWSISSSTRFNWVYSRRKNIVRQILLWWFWFYLTRNVNPNVNLTVHNIVLPVLNLWCDNNSCAALWELKWYPSIAISHPMSRIIYFFRGFIPLNMIPNAIWKLSRLKESFEVSFNIDLRDDYIQYMWLNVQTFIFVEFVMIFQIWIVKMCTKYM